MQWQSKLTLHLWYGVLYRCRFVSQLLHFQSSNLLMAWEGTWGWPNPLGPCIHERAWEKLLDSSISAALATEAIWGAIQQWKTSFSVFPSLCILPFPLKEKKSDHYPCLFSHVAIFLETLGTSPCPTHKFCCILLFILTYFSSFSELLDYLMKTCP